MNRDEFASLIRCHQAQLYRYLRYLGAPHEVSEDLTQETFMIALNGKEPSLVDQPAWLRRVARNLFLAYCRHAKCSPVFAVGPALDLAEEVWASQFPPSRDGSEHLDALRECLKALPARHRDVIEMQYRLGKSRLEMAAAVGLSEEGVKTLLRRVRAALAQCIDGKLKPEGRA